MPKLEKLKEELRLPVSLDKTGRLITLGEFITDKERRRSLSLSDLRQEQWASIVIDRIEEQPEIPLASIGSGQIDKYRAIEEIKALSPIGEALIRAEQYAIEKLVKELMEGALSCVREEYLDKSSYV
jgi:hypothetical protein